MLRGKRSGRFSGSIAKAPLNLETFCLFDDVCIRLFMDSMLWILCARLQNFKYNFSSNPYFTTPPLNYSALTAVDHKLLGQASNT